MIGALVLVAAYAGTVELSERTEVRARVVQGFPVAYDAVTTPTARALLSDRRWSYTASYSPTLSLQDLQASVTPLVLNVGTLAAAWRERTARLTLREDASYGSQNTAVVTLLAAAEGRPQALQALPKPANITTAQSRTTLATEVRPSRRWRLNTTVGYNVSGGADASSRTVLPQQRGPFADATTAYALSKTEALTSWLSLVQNQFSSGPCVIPRATATVCAARNEAALITAGWRHVVSRSTETSISAGASAVRTRLVETEGAVTHVYPAATASLTYRAGLGRHKATLRLEAQLAPVVDFRTGVTDNRAQSTASFVWREGDVTVSHSVGASRSFGTELSPPATFLTVGSEATYAIGRHAAVGAGALYSWQTSQNADAFSSAIVFVALTVRSAALRF